MLYPQKWLLMAMVFSTVLIACRQGHHKASSTESMEAVQQWPLPKQHMPASIPDNQFIDTRYVYDYAAGKQITVENSLPKGGLPYTSPTNEKYVYAIWWTRITNETDHPVYLSIDFAKSTDTIPVSPGIFCMLFFPEDSMTVDKEPQFDYGLDVANYLDYHYPERSTLHKTLHPSNTTCFYSITLFNKGVTGVLRAGFQIEGQKIVYRINGAEKVCGTISLSTLQQAVSD
jgi:hypothetical protein